MFGSAMPGMEQQASPKVTSKEEARSALCVLWQLAAEV